MVRLGVGRGGRGGRGREVCSLWNGSTAAWCCPLAEPKLRLPCILPLDFWLDFTVDLISESSPRRRPRPSQSDLEEVPPEKLSQEAFRLLRTVQSLLNTREPDLAHRLSGSGSGSGSGDSEPRSEPRSERSSVVSLDQTDDASPTPTKECGAGHAAMHTAMHATHATPNGNAHALVADVTGALRRKLNIRNSQVSLVPTGAGGAVRVGNPTLRAPARTPDGLPPSPAAPSRRGTWTSPLTPSCFCPAGRELRVLQPPARVYGRVSQQLVDVHH